MSSSPPSQPTAIAQLVVDQTHKVELLLGGRHWNIELSLALVLIHSEPDVSFTMWGRTPSKTAPPNDSTVASISTSPTTQQLNDLVDKLTL